MSTSDLTLSNETTSDTIDSLNTSEIKSKILNGELKIINKRGNSKVWNVFGKIECLTGVELPNFVVCRICNNVYKYNSKSTSNLVKHKCYLSTIKEDKEKCKIDVEATLKKLLIKDITEWTIVNSRPFQIVADSGFEKVSARLISIGATYGQNVNMATLLPHPTTVSRNIHELYDKHFERIKAEIAEFKNNGFGLTSDPWTDNFLRITYVAVTIHYIKDHTVVNKLLGMKWMENERCTSTYFLL